MWLSECTSKSLAQLDFFLEDGHKLNLQKIGNEFVLETTTKDNASNAVTFFHPLPTSVNRFDEWLAKALYDIRHSNEQKVPMHQTCPNCGRDRGKNNLGECTHCHKN